MSLHSPIVKHALTAVVLLACIALLSPLAAQQTAHSVRLLEPPEGLQVGPLRVGAVVEGEGVARVRFSLDGQLVLTKTRPPYGVEIDLGPSPRPHEIVAVAYGADGKELARDVMSVNEGPHRFAVRLISPLPGQRYSDSLRARAEPTLPIGVGLERIEYFLGEQAAGSVAAPPYSLQIDLPSTEQSYVRAVAHATDGNFAEDLVSINTPTRMDQLRINFVELYTSVLDRKRRPVEGLQNEDFAVYEDGVRQTVRRFERVLDRPVHLGILLDTSTSMLDRLPAARRTAQGFFERFVRPRDRATVITFADAPQVRVPFSSDLELLAAGLEDLEADGETTLWDSLAFSLYYFGGLKGKRAIVVLTDGFDSKSRFDRSEVIEFAQRLGVAIYPIGIDISSQEFEAESGLRRLASATGGSAFFISRARELEQAYARIEAEFRSQYLIGYQSPSTMTGAFRRVKVEVEGSGQKAHTIPGYYP